MVAKQIKTAARIHIPLGMLSTTGAGAVQARTAQGEPALSLATAATTYVIQIPLTGALQAYSVAPGTPQDNFGFRLESLQLYFLIGAVNLTAHTLTLNQEVMAGGAARQAATAAGGTLSHVVNGTAGNLPVAFSANAYLVQTTLAAPFFMNADSTLVHAEWTLATGASTGTASIYGIVLNGTHSILV